MGKRLLDLFGASLGLVLAAPVLFVVAGVVWLGLGRPVLFRQPRPGLQGKVFELVKFRTMTNAHAADGRQLPDGARLTPIGRVLRSTSLDELPTLWNVIRGEMSLVGPRPLLVDYLDLYSPEQARRHHVRPGMTGWAQVNGRNALSWEERFELDVWYVDNHTFWLDIRILFMTIGKVLSRKGISGEGEATMARFEGSAGREPS